MDKLTVELIQDLIGISTITGLLFAVVVWLLFIGYDIWHQWSFIDWKEKAKELSLMFFVMPFMVVVVAFGVVIGWPVIAFFIIRDEMRERGII